MLFVKPSFLVAPICLDPRIEQKGLYPVTGFKEFAWVRANPFLECRDNQQTLACFLIQTFGIVFEMRKAVVSEFNTKENLFLKF